MTTATKVEPTIKFLEIAKKFAPYNGRVDVDVVFDIPKPNVMTVTVDFQHGWQNDTRVYMDNSKNYQFSKNSGITGVGKVKGLKERCVSLALTFQDSFHPTPRQQDDMTAGHIDHLFVLDLKSSKEAHISFAGLPFGTWKFKGVLLVRPSASLQGRLEVTNPNNGGCRLWSEADFERHEKQDYSYGGVGHKATRTICEYVLPVAVRLWEAAEQKRSKQAWDELQEAIKRVEENIKFDKSTLEGHELELAELKNKVAQFAHNVPQEGPCIT